MTCVYCSSKEASILWLGILFFCCKMFPLLIPSPITCICVNTFKCSTYPTVLLTPFYLRFSFFSPNTTLKRKEKRGTCFGTNTVNFWQLKVGFSGKYESRGQKYKIKGEKFAKNMERFTILRVILAPVVRRSSSP